MRYALLAILLCACGRPGDRPLPAEPSSSVAERAAAVEARILDMSEPRGWVVSRAADGSLVHVGDSLLWTGMAMGVMSCAGGAVPERALLETLQSNGGRFYRHPTDAARQPSLDGHIGVYWGIAQRASRCPDVIPIWAAALATHEPVSVTRPFEHLLTAVKFQLGTGTAPQGTSNLTDAVAVWAYGVVLTKAAAYRIHLGLLSLQTLEATGAGLPGSARARFCAATSGAGMPTTDHWCARGDLVSWTEAFEFNVWEFAHQRGAWETPDGREGLVTPGLDLLVALRTLYTF